MPPTDPAAALSSLLALLAAAERSRRSAVVVQILPLLADARLPTPVRVAAAGRVLRFVPDRRRPVRRVARALTVGLPASRALERLRQLQHQLDKSDALDELLELRERHVKLACPRCKVRLPRVEMVKHLWHAHGLALENRKTRTPERVVADLRASHETTGEPDPLDAVAELTGAAGLRQWLAEAGTPAEEMAPLLVAATNRDAGLCPSCFAEVPVAVSQLPPPLTLANGRLAGDGYAVAVGGNAWVRTVAVTTPETRTVAGRRTFAPRAAASLLAALVLTGFSLTAPSRWFIALAFGLAALVYLLVRCAWSPRNPADEAVNEAWERFAAPLAERDVAARFLTRLCLASLGRGDPERRVGTLATMVARALGRCADSDAELQLLAAARVLQIEDGARFGRDTVPGVADLAALGFRGEQPADFAEFVVACYLTRDRSEGDLARLRVLLLAAAFDAGLVPRDLLDLWAGGPHLKRVMSVEPTHRLGLLYGLWRTRTARAWERVAPAETVFDLTRNAPFTSARVLAKFPDLLLYHRPDGPAEDLIGPVMICGRGVAVAGRLAADPDADVRPDRGGRELVFGRHRVELRGKLPADFFGTLRGWLRFRAEVLVPFIDGYLAPGSAEVSRRVLGPFCRKCRACGAVSAVSCGAIGREVTV
jgi:hypothetical protein